MAAAEAAGLHAGASCCQAPGTQDLVRVAGADTAASVAAAARADIAAGSAAAGDAAGGAGHVAAVAVPACEEADSAAAPCMQAAELLEQSRAVACSVLASLHLAAQAPART